MNNGSEEHVCGGAEQYRHALSGTRVLLTGAAGGIGSALSRYLSVAGCNIAAVSRSADKLEALSRRASGDRASGDPASEEGGRFEKIVADLSRSGVPRECVEQAAHVLGGLDVLINNAGVAVSAPIEETSLTEWDRQLHLNATVPFLLSQAAIPWLEQSLRAAVVNMGSVVSHKGYVGQVGYVASKHALYGMTKVLARELHPRGVRVHFLAPGGVATDMIHGIRPDIKWNELIQPEDVADAVLFLLTRRGNAVIDEIAIRRAGSEPWR